MSDVLYIDDVAGKMGMTRDALRAAVKRGHVPRPGRIGRGWAWKREEFDQWLDRQIRMSKSA